MATFSATSWNKGFWSSEVTQLISAVDSGMNAAMAVLADATPQTVDNTHISGWFPGGTLEIYGNHFTDVYDVQINRITISSPNLSMDLIGDLRLGGALGMYGSYSQASIVLNGIRITERGDIRMTTLGNIYQYNTVQDVVMPNGDSAKFTSNSIGNVVTASLNIDGQSLTASGDWKPEFINTWQDMFTGSDTLVGTVGNDYLQGYGGNDTLDAGTGTDTAAYSTRHAAYALAPMSGGYSISGPDGTDSLLSIERLQFLDAHLAFDINGNAGQVYRLYKAAFARTPDLGGLGSWINGMDTGLSLDQVATGFIGSAEFQNLYGASPTNAQFVTQLYVNVLGRAPDAGGYNYWLGELSGGLQTRAHVLATFSETAENKAATSPLVANGILYADTAQAAGPARGQAFNGTSGADTLIGSVGNDTFNGAGGNDSINGGAGIDISLYGGNRSTHIVTRSASGLTVSGGSDGTDTLLNVERLKFADIGLAFDINGNAGQTYRLYQAAFDRTPDTAGLSDWIRGMDGGMSLQTVATGFIASAEFQGQYGAHPTDTQFVNLLYANVLNRAPDQTGYDYWLGQMTGGMTRESVLIGFSESAENQATLIGVIQDGIVYFA